MMARAQRACWAVILYLDDKACELIDAVPSRLGDTLAQSAISLDAAIRNLITAPQVLTIIPAAKVPEFLSTIAPQTDLPQSVLLLKVDSFGGGEYVLLMAGSNFDSSPPNLSESLTAGRLLLRQLLREMAQDNEISLLLIDFMAVVSHEMRTPLTSIQGFARLILDDLTIHQDQLKEYVTYISAEADNLAQMIQRVQDVRRLKQGLVKTYLQPMNLPECLAPLLEKFKQRSREAAINFKIHVEMTDPIITGDVIKLPQMLDALLDNSFKYTPLGGRVELAITRHKDAVAIDITDTSCGIAPEDMPFIFDEFYRGKHSPMRYAPGLGLGLTLARQIIELHHGTIDVESHLGQGTTIRIRLPQTKDSLHE